jgi:hypothetical protein
MTRESRRQRTGHTSPGRALAPRTIAQSRLVRRNSPRYIAAICFGLNPKTRHAASPDAAAARRRNSSDGHRTRLKSTRRAQASLIRFPNIGDHMSPSTIKARSISPTRFGANTGNWARTGFRSPRDQQASTPSRDLSGRKRHNGLPLLCVGTTEMNSLGAAEPSLPGS